MWFHVSSMIEQRVHACIASLCFRDSSFALRCTHFWQESMCSTHFCLLPGPYNMRHVCTSPSASPFKLSSRTSCSTTQQLQDGEQSSFRLIQTLQFENMVKALSSLREHLHMFFFVSRSLNNFIQNSPRPCLDL